MPLRQYSSNSKEMQSMETIQGGLVSIAKDFDSVQKKADKLKDKAGKNSSTKAATTSSSTDDANQQ